MGMFDFLFARRKASNTLEDCIWISGAAKFAGIVRQMRTAQETFANVVVTAHFPSTMQLVARALRDWQADFEPISSPFKPRQLAQRPAGKVMLIEATHLVADRVPGGQPAGGPPVRLIAAERYPLREHDDLLSEFALELPTGSQLQFHVALDDPLMKPFAAGRTASILKLLGMSEDQPISEKGITRAIERAQRRFAKKATSDLSATSPEAWFARNCPGVG